MARFRGSDTSPKAEYKFQRSTEKCRPDREFGKTFAIRDHKTGVTESNWHTPSRVSRHRGHTPRLDRWTGLRRVASNGPTPRGSAKSRRRASECLPFRRLGELMPSWSKPSIVDGSCHNVRPVAESARLWRFSLPILSPVRQHDRGSVISSGRNDVRKPIRIAARNHSANSSRVAIDRSSVDDVVRDAGRCGQFPDSRLFKLNHFSGFSSAGA